MTPRRRSLVPRHVERRTRAAGAVVSVLLLTGCGSGSGAHTSSASPTPTSAPGTSTTATSGGASNSSGGDAGNSPIGKGGIDLGSGAPSTSYPALMLSQDLAKDCYSGGDRIYDRYGITCADATKVLQRYEASSQSISGGQLAVDRYTCSHNPVIMVNQGAAPGKCVDSGGNVVFNWRYPGAPLPARG